MLLVVAVYCSQWNTLKVYTSCVAKPLRADVDGDPTKDRHLKVGRVRTYERSSTDGMTDVTSESQLQANVTGRCSRY